MIVFPFSGRLSRAKVIYASAGIAAILAFWHFATRLPPVPERPLRIGFEQNPPVQIRTDNGFAGIAVETVNEAAKRAGIRLQWTETGTSSDEAFQKGLVDLWPLMADLPDRRKHVHITKPWLHSNHGLLVRADSASPDQKFSGRIALVKMPLHVRLVRQDFPNAELAEFPDARNIARAVCRGDAAAGFLEGHVAMSVLKDMPPECAGIALRIQTLSDLTLEHGVASTFAAAGAAEALRREIASQFRDGTLAGTLAKYSYYGLDDTWATYVLMEAAERARWLTWGIGAMIAALVVALWRVFSSRQHKRAAEALRESERRHQEVFNNTSDCIFLLDVAPDGRFKFAGFNPAEELAVGLSNAEVSGRFVEEVLAGDLAKKVIANYRRCLESGTLTSYEEELSLPCGRRHFHTNLIPVRSGSGRIHRIVGVARDISERKQAEAALRESEERFRNMADTAPVMIWVSGADKACTFFNKAWLTFTGRTVEQELGDGWAEGVHPNDKERCFATYSSSFDSRQNFQMEYRLRRADGAYRWVLDSGVPRFAPGGGFAGYIGSCIDITDLRDAQEKAIETQKLESLSVMTGGVAHDFNNLLGSILSEAELAQTELPEGSAREGLQRIKTVAIRGAEIVRELMIYSGQNSTNFEPVDVSRLVEEMAELLRVSISKHAVLKTDLPKNLPAVLGNATEIRRVAMNLIINASEAIGEESGVISVSTSRLAATNASADAYVRLEVSDTGCGMAEQAKAKIFDPFFTTKFAGRGLGLAVVLGIVRAHKGEIKLASTPGRGTTFQILLPCAGERELREPSAAVPATNEQSSEAPGNVLVVEDEETLRVSVSKMLRKKGFAVIEAGDGSAAIDLFYRNQDSINVILLDMTIPGASSREVIAEVRRLRPNVKVILTSAYSREMAMLGVEEPQITGFIRKPFQFGSLVQMLMDTVAAPATGSS